MDTQNCKGRGCSMRETCAKYRPHWLMPLGTLHWWGVAPGSCRHYERKLTGDERDTLNAAL